MGVTTSRFTTLLHYRLGDVDQGTYSGSRLAARLRQAMCVEWHVAVFVVCAFHDHFIKVHCVLHASTRVIAARSDTPSLYFMAEVYLEKYTSQDIRCMTFSPLDLHKESQY